MKFIFDGVFNGIDVPNLYIKYILFIQALDKKKYKFILSNEEINEIIIINEDEWDIIECNVELFFGSENKSRYEISVKLKNEFNNGIFKS